MKKVLIVGASSGIGRELSLELLRQDYEVWATSRDNEALESLLNENKGLGKVYISTTDVRSAEEMAFLVESLNKSNFVPDVVVLSAGIGKSDLTDNLDINITREIMETNFFGAMNCVTALLPYVPKNAQFVAISSTSAIKGTAYQGIGYGASKAALSLAFESFFMKWSGSGPLFSTVYFGPVETPLHKSKGTRLFLMSTQQAVKYIIKVIEKRKPVYYRPTSLFLFLRFSKLLPSIFYLKMMNYLESKIQ
jgi:short-subunit dehydrogenase